MKSIHFMSSKIEVWMVLNFVIYVRYMFIVIASLINWILYDIDSRLNCCCKPIYFACSKIKLIEWIKLNIIVLGKPNLFYLLNIYLFKKKSTVKFII